MITNITYNNEYEIELKYIDNYIFTIIVELDKLLKFKKIKFGKKAYDIYLFELTNLNIKNYSLVTREFYDLTYLPNKLDTLEVLVNKQIKLIKTPSELKKIIIRADDCSYNINIYNKLKFNKILFINTDITNYNNEKTKQIEYFNYKYNILCLTGENSLYDVEIFKNIDIYNLSNYIKVLYISFYKGRSWLDENKKIKEINDILEYLPNSVEKIIFHHHMKFNLNNIPSSVKTLEFVNATIFDLELFNKIPDFIENLHIFDVEMNNLNKLMIFKFPKNLKKIVVNEDREIDFYKKILHKLNNKSQIIVEKL
jgi:hypothetical protein